MSEWYRSWIYGLLTSGLNPLSAQPASVRQITQDTVGDELVFPRDAPAATG